MEKTKFSVWMNRLLTMFMIMGLFMATSCGDDDPDPGQEPDMDIYELIQSTDGLDSLAKYLGNYPDLMATLKSTGPFTVFAPDNQAFQSLLETPGFPQDIADINPDIIKGVLAYHVVPGQEIGGSELGPDMTTAYNSEVIKVNSDGTLLTGATNKNITVKTTDILATNGVLHITGSVLIPPSVGESLTPILGTLAGTVLLGSDFTYLADLIGVADSEVPDGQMAIKSILASAGPLTAFIPPNAVFEAAASGASVTVEEYIDGFSPAQARNYLMTHLTADANAVASSFTNGMTFTAMSGETLTITVEDSPTTSPTGILVSAPGNSSPVPVVVTDVSPGNGTIGHAIEGLLLPGP